MNKLRLIVLLIIVPLFFCNAQDTDDAGKQLNCLKFNFGSKTNINNYRTVNAETVYSDTLGYGFDYNTKPEIVCRSKKNKLNSEFAFAETPFYFSVKLPEGNYKVTLTLGDIAGLSATTIKAENRRLMLEDIQTEKGQTINKSITINVRTPKINDSLSIRLKTREYKYLNWDNKLTLEFIDKMPCVCALEIERTEPKHTIYLAGNSTVTDQYAEPWASWGQMITRYFNQEVCVANFAESGESLHSFYYSNRLAKILSLIKPGDYIFIEFGHNDQKRKGEGIGPWQSYSDYLRMYIEKAREKGANPVLITSMHRRSFDKNGEVVNTLGDFPAAMRAIAIEKKVPLVELNNMSKILYEAWGIEGSKKGFVHYPANTYPGQVEKLSDNTHFNNYGAYNLALCIIKGIIDNNLELTNYLYDIPENFDPANPIPFSEWRLPESLGASNEKPEGS